MTGSARRFSRRGFLVGGLGAAGIAAAPGCSKQAAGGAGDDPVQLTAESLSTPTIAPEPIATEWVQSTARSAQVELVTIRPAGVIGKLPVCLALHGRSANAKIFLDLGVPDALNLATSTTGTRPFAVVSVDGGDSYWVARQPSDDPQKMLLQDLPIWLSNRGFEPTPFAAMGISMGGYGALNYARNPGLAAVAAISSALFDNWTEARKRNAFASEAAWEATEPLRHIDELSAATQLGVWCGTSDPFITQSRRLIERAHPRISAITAGDHTEPYWRRILPEVLRFIGAAAPAV